MIYRLARATTVAVAVILGTAMCDSAAEPDDSESWVADITSRQQVLFMTFRRNGTELTGSGTLAALTNVGGETLTLTGTRTTDSLTVTFRRNVGNSFRFAGRYIGPGITGVLDGAEFVQVNVSFRAR
jgi:hypothetical protein